MTIQFTAVNTEIVQETFKLYSEKKKGFYCTMFQCMSHNNLHVIPNDAECNTFSIIKKKKKETFDYLCDILPGNAILLIATSSAFKYSTFEDTNEQKVSLKITTREKKTEY